MYYFKVKENEIYKVHSYFALFYVIIILSIASMIV